MTTKTAESPRIGLIITPDGVRGTIVLGDTLRARQRSLVLLDLLEPDLIEVQRLLNQRIETLKKGFPELLRI